MNPIARTILSRTGRIALPLLLAALSACSHSPAERATPTQIQSDRGAARADSVVLAPQAEVTPIPRSASPDPDGILVFTARSGGRDHIWGLEPGVGVPFQITRGDWDDGDPAVSPDRRQLAFTSNRAGAWDLYLLDLESGGLRQVTDTLEFEGRPTWSPDSRWLAYEARYTDNFDIWILPIDGSQAPIQLTTHAAQEHSPAWAPDGRQIVFTSSRDGLTDIYLADLDRPAEPFVNLTQTSEFGEYAPAVSPDGAQLAYAVEIDGLRGLQLIDLAAPADGPHWVGEGAEPAWIGDDGVLGGLKSDARGSRLVTYSTRAGSNSVSPSLEGRISDLSWAPVMRPGFAVVADMNVDLQPATVLTDPSRSGGRLALIPLLDVDPQGLELSDGADEAYNALRERVEELAGWDFLSQLEYGFVGINDPLPPGFAYNDWLYTGRAFYLSSAAQDAGWLEVVREDYGPATYWRVFVRTNSDLGDLGRPLDRAPWDFAARFAEGGTAYDLGGSLRSQIPDGNFVDFTKLAADYGFERVPALANWRSFMPGARYGEFVLREGMDWESAMSELYPASAIATPAPYRTPTPTPTYTPRPTSTPWWWQWRTPTPTVPTPTPTQTNTATVTPTP